MNDILIMAGIALASASAGGAITWLVGFRHPEWSYRVWWLRALTERNACECRIKRALHHIPPYSCGANGSLQKIGKILRGEED